MNRWLQGDCLAFARALQRALGPGAALYDVVEPTPPVWRLTYPGSPHHVVVRWRGKFYDALGEHEESSLLQLWTERARVHGHRLHGPFVLEPHSVRRAADAGLRARPGAVAEAAELARQVAIAAGAAPVGPRTTSRYRG